MTIHIFQVYLIFFLYLINFHCFYQMYSLFLSQGRKGKMHWSTDVYHTPLFTYSNLHGISPWSKYIMNTFENLFVFASASWNSSSDNFSHHVTSHKLNSHNYLQWLKFVLVFIFGWNKDDFLTGMTKTPNNEEST